MTLPDPALEAAAKATYMQYYGPSMNEPRPTAREFQVAESAISAFLAAFGGRVVVERSCEHGKIQGHVMKWDGELCPGGERIVIWEGEEK